jgi:predicted dehydrogenase
MDVTGVGIVGLSASGGWAARAHVPALNAIDGLELRALTASSPESAAAAAGEYGVPACADVRELAERDDVDLVVVAVKVPHHLELVTPALEAGKMVLSEWPLGNGLAEAEQMAALARARGVRTFTGLQARSAPVVRYLRDLVADGYVGKVLSTTLVLSGRSWGGLVAAGNRYTLDPSNGATLLTISFGHQIDGMALVLGEFAELSATMASRRTEARVRETGDIVPMRTPDQIGIVGTLESGAVAAMHIRGGSSRGLNFHWEINGTEGDLVVETPTGLLQFATVRGGRGDEQGLTELPVPAEYHRVPALAGQEDGVAYAVAHAYRQLREDLENGTFVAPDFDHAVRRHHLMEMIEASAATGTRFSSG